MFPELNATPVHSFPADLPVRYRDEGFVRLPGFLDAAEVAFVRAELARYIGEVIPRMPESEVFYERKGERDSLKQIQRMFQWDDFSNSCF